MALSTILRESGSDMVRGCGRGKLGTVAGVAVRRKAREIVRGTLLVTREAICDGVSTGQREETMIKLRRSPAYIHDCMTTLALSREA